jgi:hypothetical protein
VAAASPRTCFGAEGASKKEWVETVFREIIPLTIFDDRSCLLTPGSATPGMEDAQLAERAMGRDAIDDESKVPVKVL